MIFKRDGLRMPGIIALAAVLSAASGCGGVASPPPVPTVSVIAPVEVKLPVTTGVMILPVTVHLRNHTRWEIKLFAPTPCAVFRWAVVTEKRQVQSQPNRLCAQVVASGALQPGRQTAQFYEIALNPERYTAGGNYRLEYRFWGYPGHHEFSVKDASASH